MLYQYLCPHCGKPVVELIDNVDGRRIFRCLFCAWSFSKYETVSKKIIFAPRPKKYRKISKSILRYVHQSRHPKNSKLYQYYKKNSHEISQKLGEIFVPNKSKDGND